MSQREAFEAHMSGKCLYPDFQKRGNGYKNNFMQWAWVGWQAAIQHARDVAVQRCEYVGMVADAAIRQGAVNQYHEGRSDGAAQCAAAIKEALK